MIQVTEGALMHIGALASRVGMSVRALRYYEEQDLLASARRAILELLPCVETGDVTPALLDRQSAERDRIDTQVSTLVKTRNRLDAIITTASTARSAGRPCPR
ncbi:MerR family DNA-binding transcriptional regulator [Streptomyces hokutonensis]|uniref:MerR family DNA-binding transcriptional regulator n=1 Tax=Streptomyces hokutonensis TaxID=1306990 RepID=UPI00369F85BF